jgi:hypothetical protein
MLYHEFNMDKALAVRYAEDKEEGMEKLLYSNQRYPL